MGNFLYFNEQVIYSTDNYKQIALKQYQKLFTNIT